MNKYSFLPIQNAIIYDLYNRHKSSLWLVERIENIRDDKLHYDNLPSYLKVPLNFILGLFAQFDGLVIENLVDGMRSETTKLIKEAGHFYSVQVFMETIHNHTYSLLIDAYIDSQEEKNKLFNAIDNFKVIKKIANWGLKWMSEKNKTLEKIIAFACVEGIIFSSAFVFIFFLKNSQEKLKALFLSNDYISRDEGLHTIFAVALYNEIAKLSSRLDEEVIFTIVREAVQLNDEFIDESFGQPIPNLAIEDIKIYVRKCADNIVKNMGYKAIYGVENPFIWMHALSLDGRENFFDVHPTIYISSAESVDYDNDLDM